MLPFLSGSREVANELAQDEEDCAEVGVSVCLGEGTNAIKILLTQIVANFPVPSLAFLVNWVVVFVTVVLIPVDVSEFSLPGDAAANLVQMLMLGDEHHHLQELIASMLTQWRRTLAVS